MKARSAAPAVSRKLWTSAGLAYLVVGCATGSAPSDSTGPTSGPDGGGAASSSSGGGSGASPSSGSGSGAVQAGSSSGGAGSSGGASSGGAASSSGGSSSGAASSSSSGSSGGTGNDGGARNDAGAGNDGGARNDAGAIKDSGTSNDGGPTRSVGCGTAPTLQTGATVHLQIDGSDRFYILDVPTNYNNTQPHRLVLAYHARGFTAGQVANVCGAAGSEGTACDYYHLKSLSNGTTIFAAPMGEGTGADTGWPNPNNDDIALSDAIISQLESTFCVDTTRIFATGWSFGGAMSYEMACERPNEIRAVAIYSGSMLSGACVPTVPVAYYASHGLGDTVLPIANGEALRDDFVTANGCTAQTPPDPATGSGMHICTSYQGCSAGHPVTWCSFDGPHTPDPNPVTTNGFTSWEWAQAWSFLSQF